MPEKEGVGSGIRCYIVSNAREMSKMRHGPDLLRTGYGKKSYAR
jgi:hypothetical protein